MIAGSGSPGVVLNVGGDDELSIRELAKRVIGLTNSHSELKIIDYRYDDAPEVRLFLDKSKINQLGYRTCIGFNEGLKRTAEWYKNEDCIVS